MSAFPHVCLPHPFAFYHHLLKLPNNALFLHPEITNSNNKLVAIKIHVPGSLPAKDFISYSDDMFLGAQVLLT